MDNAFAEHTERLVEVNADRLHQKHLAEKATHKYDNLVKDIRDDYHQDAVTTKAKYSDNQYELARFRYNSNFYANIRNGFLALIILTLLLRMDIITPVVAYIIGAVITVALCVYVWVSNTYQHERRSGVVFNDYVAGRSMDPPSAGGECPSGQ